MDICILQPAYRSLDIEKAIAEENGFSVGMAGFDAHNKLSAEAADARVILVRDLVLDAQRISQLSACKAVIRYGVGYNTVDLDVLSGKGIMLCNIPDYDTDEVSTHSLALYLAARRRLITRNRDMRLGKWALDESEPIQGAKGRVAAIIGYGRIARRFHDKIRALGFDEILVYDPFVDDEIIEKAGARAVSKSEAIAKGSLVALFMPLTEMTQHFIDRAALASMRSDCILVNASRGGLVDEAALYEALESQAIEAAGFDVFEQEPPRVDNPLFKLDNFIATDHCGWYSERSMRDLRTKAVEEAIRVLSSQAPKSCVNLNALKMS